MKVKEGISEEEVKKIIDLTIMQELDDSQKFENLEELHKFIGDISEKFIYMRKDQFIKWLNGEDLVGVSAVYCIIRSLEKVLNMINVSMELLDEEDKGKHRKIFVIMAHRMACLFDFMYAAALDNPNDVFYNKDPENEDLKLLLDGCTFYMAKDPVKHREATQKRVQAQHEAIAIAMRGFKHKNIVKQAFSSISWAVYYKIKKRKVWDHGTFLASILDKEALVRVFKLLQSNYMVRQNDKSKDLPKGGVKQVITIKFSENDMITEDNLESEERPEMIKEDLDLPFGPYDEEMDKNTHYQIRINCDKDWDRINWK